MNSTSITEISELVNKTSFIDTHEHLIEEKERLAPPGSGMFPCGDFAYLFWGYAASDLESAGMPAEDLKRFFGLEADVDEKWRLVEPFWQRIRHTGYGRALCESIRALYGIDDLTTSTYAHVDAAFRKLPREGYYYQVLRDVAGIEHCHVNSLQDVCLASPYPDLLKHDISLLALTQPDLALARLQCPIDAKTLGDWIDTIDWFLERYGPCAPALKSQIAYLRRLDFHDVPEQDAASIYRKLADSVPLEPSETKALQDFLFHHVVEKAEKMGLPIKLHTGYYAGLRSMPLDRLATNPADLCRLANRHPEARFVVMHIGYPFQEQMIALAKQYPNVTIDMCWAWIVNPAASIRFLKDFLMAVPSNKLLTFGGDYVAVEQVVGHARIARVGIAQALSELVREGWLTLDDALALAGQLMNGNARSLFHQNSFPNSLNA